MPQVIERRYTPIGTAAQVFKRRDQELLIVGPAGTGKSRACLEKVHRMCLLNPGMRALICRKTQTSMSNSALVTWREHVIKEALEVGDVRFYGGSAQLPPHYRYTNTSTVALGGLDKATKVMSTEYDLIYCVTGDTVVSSPSAIERVFRRPYTGQLVTIRTATGHQLTGTPNHPVFTAHGWRGLGELREGDQVVGDARQQYVLGRPNPHVYEKPAHVADLFRAQEVAGAGLRGTQRIGTVPMDFHGDGVADGYVDIVTVARHLQPGARAARLQHVPQGDGEWGDLELPLLVGASPELLLGAGGDASGVCGHDACVRALADLVTDLTGHASARGSSAGLPEPGDPLGVTLEPQRSFLADRPDLHSALDQLALDAARVDAGLTAEALHAHLPAEVALDEVVDVRVFQAPLGCHVYNLQTVDSWYYASNIVSHNCQEATELTENDWEALGTRLRNGKVSFQQLLADCNPDRPTHWLHERCVKGLTGELTASHTDNPRLYRDGVPTEEGRAYLERLDRLTGVRRLRLLQGVWAAADGLVYDEFDPALHVINHDWNKVRHCPRFWTVDFGYTNPFTCQMWGQDPDGRLYLYREIYMTRRTVDQHCESIAKAVMRNPKKINGGQWVGEWVEPQPTAIYCDHDAEGRVVFERALGLRTQNANKAVQDGIQAVQRRLRPAGDGKPRIYFMRDTLVERDPNLDDAKSPTCLLDEITGYVWDKAPKSQGDDRLKDAPLKRDDHGCDAMRYLCMALEKSGSSRFRSFLY